jgi:hypothetical protein
VSRPKILALTVFGAAVALLVLGIPSPRFASNGGGGGVTGKGRSYDVTFVANSSARPWTITGVRLEGFPAIASHVAPQGTYFTDSGFDISAIPSAPMMTPYRVGAGQKVEVLVAADLTSLPCEAGLRRLPDTPISVRVDSWFGEKWIRVGSTGTLATGC